MGRLCERDLSGVGFSKESAIFTCVGISRLTQGFLDGVIWAIDEVQGALPLS